MYPEFVAIYVMLGIVIAILAVVLVLLIKLLKNGATGASAYPSQQQNNNPYYAQQQYQQPYQAQYQPQGGNVVFCQQCATQFDASQMYCPNCGARR